jgi:hypothetical protein
MESLQTSSLLCTEPTRSTFFLRFVIRKHMQYRIALAPKPLLVKLGGEAVGKPAGEAARRDNHYYVAVPPSVRQFRHDAMLPFPLPVPFLSFHLFDSGQSYGLRRFFFFF